MSRKALYADVEKHAVQTPWIEEDGRFCSSVCIKFQARSKEGTVIDIDNYRPAEDQDLAYELQALASLSMERVRYLTRKKRDRLLESEQNTEVRVAVGALTDQLASIGDALRGSDVSIFLAEPEVQDGDEAPPEHWAGNDPTTTPPS